MAEISTSEAHLDASTSNATVGPLVPLRNYDVFVNHRGSDVKRGFVSHLVKALEDVNVSTFADYKDLYPGEKNWDALKSAIYRSKVHIAIFSPTYAGSPWCLKELHEMIQCHNDGCSQLFLPVFFKVEPSDLRYPSSDKSCYSKAFTKHCERNERNELIDEWKLALSEASEISGPTFDSKGFESELVEVIVSDVLKVLNANISSVDKHPVGVDEKVQEALKLMKAHETERGLQKLAICGMIGVGKTTLAKSIFAQIHKKFDRFCFIESVRAQAQTPFELRRVQEHILSALLKREVKLVVYGIPNVEQAMKQRLQNLKILVIHDDIDNRAQLDALVQPFNFCSLKDGSYLVITSRDEQVVKWAVIRQQVYLKGLSEVHANQIFNCHAFLCHDDPPEELKTLSKKVVKACQGLPLGVVTLGKHLCGMNVDYWKTTVEVLEGRHRLSAPAQHELASILRNNFDGLPPLEQRVFLDVACSMLGQHEARARRVWGESAADWLWLENLIMKSLVGLDYSGRLMMHDILRDMGREIGGRSYLNKGQRSHSRDEANVKDVLLQQQQGASEVRAVHLALGDQEQWNTKSFDGMDSLRFLLVEGKGNITGNFRLFPRQLTWLQWHGCPWTSLPRKLDLSKVAVLDLEGSAISSLSNDYMLENLRELSLRCCPLEALPDLQVCCKKLEVLDLSHCRNLEEVPDAIECLSSTLTHLDLSACERLASLPRSLGRLHALKSLKLDGCCSLEVLVDAFQNLTALEEIGLTDLRSPKVLPQSLGSLTNLPSLDLYKSERLQELPSTVDNLQKLSSLSVRCCGIWEIPAAVSSLTNLVCLIADRCLEMAGLPEEIGNLCNLERLHLMGCKGLSHLPSSIGTLGKLVTLDLSGCNIGERGLPTELCNLSSLRHLSLSDNPLLSLPEHLHLLTGLQTLDVQDCDDLREIPQLPFSLEELSTSQCRNLTQVCKLPPSLKCWSTGNCPSLMRLPSLHPGDCSAGFEELYASRCAGLSNDVMEKFAGLASLRRLHLDGTGVSFGPWIEKLVFLEEVILDGESLPVCFIRYKHEVQVRDQTADECMDCHFEVTVPDTGESMEDCKGFVLCATNGQGFAESVQVKTRAPAGGEEVMPKLLYRTSSTCDGLWVRIFRGSLKGGTILSFEFRLNSSKSVVPEAAVRLMHKGLEFKEIMSELALAGVGQQYLTQGEGEGIQGTILHGEKEKGSTIGYQKRPKRKIDFSPSEICKFGRIL